MVQPQGIPDAQQKEAFVIIVEVDIIEINGYEVGYNVEIGAGGLIPEDLDMPSCIEEIRDLMVRRLTAGAEVIEPVTGKAQA